MAETKITQNEIQSTGWTPYIAVTPTFTSTTDGVDTISFAATDVTDILSKGTKLKITSTAGTHYYYCTGATFSTNTTVTLVGETSVSGTISEFNYSYADCPQGFKRGEDWYKARVYLSSDQSVTADTLTNANFQSTDYDPNSDITYPYYVAPITGTYELNGTILFKGIAADKNITAQVYVFDGSVDTETIYAFDSQGNTGWASVSTYSPIQLNRGNQVRLKVTQTDTVTRDLHSDKSKTFLTTQFTGI